MLITLLVCSLFLLLILIPISFRIRDISTDAIVIRDTSDPVVLAHVDALWHWEAVITTNDLLDDETLTIFLTHQIKSQQNNLIINTSILYEDIIYALSGSSVTSLNDSTQFNVTQYDDETPVCIYATSCDLMEDGYYSINILSGGSVVYSINTINISYYNDTDNDVIICTITSYDNQCVLEFDNIHPYYLLASLTTSSSSSDIINISIDNMGRQTWYTLTTLLIIPALLISIVLCITLCCICLK